MSSAPSTTSADAVRPLSGDLPLRDLPPGGVTPAGGAAPPEGGALPHGPAPSAVVPRPGFAFMRPRLARWIALGFGSGLSPRAPGTVGTLWAWVAWLALPAHWPAPAQAALIALGLAIGPWACARTAHDLGVKDHGAIVWDEIVAFWIVLMVLPATIGWQLAGFALFRLLDATKPPPIGWADRRVPGGLGVMLDDLLAAFLTLFLLALARPWL
ncbi:MAG: phosphatidylglycerophosphatase A [Betaproteobacteria bacterium]|nr:phosphatidylglycerophosphatase A [Betaproteobacteria bacterium]